MTMSPLQPICKRVGTVLIVAGTLDTLAMAWCAARGLVYPSSLTVFALVAGFFLLRDSLSAAALTRWTAALLLPMLLAALLLGPWIYPLDLLRTQWQLYPVATAVILAGLALPLPLLAWVVRQLNQGAVHQALAAEKKCWNLRGAVLLGAGLMLLLTALVHQLLTSDLAREVRTLAQQQLGPDYRYQMVMMEGAWTEQGVKVSADVVAWKQGVIKLLSVQWQE